MKKRQLRIFIALSILAALAPFASAKSFVWAINGVASTGTVVLADEGQDLGAITSFVDPASATSVQVAAQTPGILIWLGAIGDKSQQSTTSFSGHVWACLDSDSNNQCDIDQAEGCLNKDGDWYNGFCCGVDVACGYVGTETVHTTVYVKKSPNDIVAMTNTPPTTGLLGGLIFGQYSGYTPITTTTLYIKQGSNRAYVRTTPAYGYTALSAPTVYITEGKDIWGSPIITAITTTPPPQPASFWGGIWTGLGTNPPKAIKLYSVHALNAYCGNTADGVWEWAPAADAGQVHRLDGCPNRSVIADGTALYQCGSAQAVDGIQAFGGMFRNVTLGAPAGSYVLVEEQLSNQPKSGAYCRLYNPGKYPPGTYGTDMPVGSIGLPGAMTIVTESTAAGQPITTTKTIADGVVQYAWGATGCYPDGSYTCAASNTNDYCASYPAKVWRPLEATGLHHSVSCIDGVLHECGGTGAFSADALPLGSILPDATPTYYCSSDGDWTTDLDAKDAQSCTAAGFSWTGERCCGEADDPDEYYNDPGYPNGTGGCWNKAAVAAGDFAVPDRVLNYKGQFFGCRITDASLLALKDTHTDDWLINNSITPCGAVLLDAQPGGKPHAVCQPDGVWRFTDEPGGTINKSIAWSGLISLTGITQSGCCAWDQCWDGKNCQPLGAFYRIGEYGFVCKI